MQYSYQIIVLLSPPSHLFTLDLFVASRIFRIFFYPLHKQDPKVLNENSYFPYAPLSGAKKEKASLFSMSQASVFRTNELQRSQQSLVSGVSFPKQVSRPLAPLTGLCWFGLGSPGCRRCAHRLEKQAGTLKKRVFGKGRLGWGVEETCWLTLAALIAAHSRWIIPCIYFKLTYPPPPLLGRVRFTSMPKTDNALWHCALMAEFIDIFIRVGPKSRRREALKTIFLPEVL